MQKDIIIFLIFLLNIIKLFQKYQSNQKNILSSFDTTRYYKNEDKFILINNPVSKKHSYKKKMGHY